MDLAALRSRVARRWWVVAILAALTVAGTTVATGESGEEQTTIKFVMRPDASVSTHDLPAALDALKSDSPLVQTVIGVLGSRSMLRQGATEAGVTLPPGYSVDAVAEPGSTLIDSTRDRARQGCGGPARGRLWARGAHLRVRELLGVRARAPEHRSGWRRHRAERSPGGDPGPAGGHGARGCAGGGRAAARTSAERVPRAPTRRPSRGRGTRHSRRRAGGERGATAGHATRTGGAVRAGAETGAEVRAGRAVRAGGAARPDHPDQAGPAPEAGRSAGTDAPEEPRPDRSGAWHGHPVPGRSRTGSRSARLRPRRPPPRPGARPDHRPRTTADVQEAGLRRHAPPRLSGAGIALWAGRIAVAAAAFGVGTALGRASDPLHLVLLAGLGAIAVAAAIAQVRWALVAVLFLLVAYVPDVLASRSSAHALIVILLAGVVLRRATGRERLRHPPRAPGVRRARARVHGGFGVRQRSRRRGGGDGRPAELRRGRGHADGGPGHARVAPARRVGRGGGRRTAWRSWPSSSSSRRATGPPTGAWPPSSRRATPCAAPAR